MAKARKLNPEDEPILFDYIKTTRYPIRNKLMFLFSLKAGLRVGEIAQLKWDMILDNNNHVKLFMFLPAIITKAKKGEREIPISDSLKESILEHKNSFYFGRNFPVILNERGDAFTPNSLASIFLRHYKKSGLTGSSHSGRRTFITNTARKISLCGGSIYDVSKFAGHKWIATTQRYIDENQEAQMSVVNML